MERVEDLGRAGRLTRGGPLVSGERVHRHDLDVVAERFRPRGEPVGERPPAPALGHVQEPGGTPVPPGRRIHGHGHIPAAPGRVPPHVLVHAQHPCPVEPAFVADQVPQPPGQDRVVDHVPRAGRIPGACQDALRPEHDLGDRPPRGRIRHRVAVRDGAGQVVRPPSPAPPALVAAHTHQQMRRSLPDRHVHQPARPRRPDTRHAIAGTTRPGRRVGLRLAADQPHTAPVSPLHMALGHRTQPEAVQPERHATVKRDTLVTRTRCLIRFSIHTTNKTTRPLPSTYTPKPEEPIKGCWWVNPPTPP